MLFISLYNAVSFYIIDPVYYMNYNEIADDFYHFLKDINKRTFRGEYKYEKIFQPLRFEIDIFIDLVKKNDTNNIPGFLTTIDFGKYDSLNLRLTRELFEYFLHFLSLSSFGMINVNNVTFYVKGKNYTGESRFSDFFETVYLLDKKNSLDKIDFLDFNRLWNYFQTEKIFQVSIQKNTRLNRALNIFTYTHYGWDGLSGIYIGIAGIESICCYKRKDKYQQIVDYFVSNVELDVCFEEVEELFKSRNRFLHGNVLMNPTFTDDVYIEFLTEYDSSTYCNALLFLAIITEISKKY